MRFHFLNVGKGSSTVIEFARGRLGLFDIDDSQTFREEDYEGLAEMLGLKAAYDSRLRVGQYSLARDIILKAYERKFKLTDPIAYINDNFPGERIFRFILTHPDMDHLSGVDRLLGTRGFLNFWDTDNDKEINPDEWQGSPYRKQDWDTYQKIRASTKDPKCIRPTAGTVDKYYDEDRIEILAPDSYTIQLAKETGDYNHISYVLRVHYNARTVLLGGDATVEVWDHLLEEHGSKLESTVLLAPHHGSKKNFHKEAMEAVGPELIIVSVGRGTEYTYAQYAALGKVLATKSKGNIIYDASEHTCITQYS